MRAGILFGLLFLTFSAPAQAKPHRMTFEFAAVVAVDYWAKRGVAVPCHPQQRVFTAPEAVELQRAYVPAGFDRMEMVAYVDACTVGITPEAHALRNDREYAWMYCMEITHEIGHLAGLDHPKPGEIARYGVMDPEQNIVPWGCDHPIKFRRYWHRSH